MWAIYHRWACLLSPHWAIGGGWLSRILIAGSSLQPGIIPLPTPVDRSASRESEIVSRPSSLLFPSQSSRLQPCTACRSREEGGGTEHTRTHTAVCRISPWNREESVTHAAGPEVDYRTPTEICLKLRTDGGKGLTASTSQSKHLHTCNRQHYAKRRQRTSSLNRKNI